LRISMLHVAQVAEIAAGLTSRAMLATALVLTVVLMVPALIRPLVVTAIAVPWAIILDGAMENSVAGAQHGKKS
jgi:hypothetical protein